MKKNILFINSILLLSILSSCSIFPSDFSSNQIDSTSNSDYITSSSSDEPLTSSSTNINSNSSSSDNPIDDTIKMTYSHKFLKTDFNIEKIDNRDATNGGTTSNINGLTWTYNSTKFLNTSGINGIQIGATKVPQTDYFTLSTSFNEEVKVLSFFYEVANASKGGINVKVSLDEEDYIKSYSNNETEIYSFTDINKSCTSFSFSIKTTVDAKAIYFNQIGFEVEVASTSTLSLKEDDPIEKTPIEPGTGKIPATKYDISTYSNETYYMDLDKTLHGDLLRKKLNSIITDNIALYSYGDARYTLQYIDEDLNNPGYVYCMYDGDIKDSTWIDGSTWNREHVWCQSRMKLNQETETVKNDDKDQRSDLHNLRAACQNINSAHGNKFYDNSTSNYYFYPNVEKGTLGKNHKYEGDHRGDTARILFYMYVRYLDLDLKDELENDTTLDMGKLSVLLEWNKVDPVDKFEIQRNNRIYEYQGNRNPFIDYPTLVDNLFNI